ncbi:hypothetical protein DL96DRAFT_1235844 [Flagelloscypha sp. PMI_526]|nr:hypothetical protein DL96DRAFT_1235844 [Flagelloscypha sp. PMI_526]
MDRPRRSTRQPAQPTPTILSRPSKSTAPTVSKPIAERPTSEEQLERLLRNPKSDLTTMDISRIFNAQTWAGFSEQDQNELKALFPPVAFREHTPSLGDDHPAYIVSGESNSDDFSARTLDPAIFTDAHFLSAARTLQDHIFSGWKTKVQEEKELKYLEGIRNGSLHAPWKDDEWVQWNAGGAAEANSHKWNNRAGEAADIKLADLAKDGVLLENDILAYKRNFSQLGLTIEKDILIRSIDPKTHTLDVLLQPGTQKLLPPGLIRRIGPEEPDRATRAATISSPTSLETAILDTDARVSKERRPNGNAWKCLTVWRFTGNIEEMSDLGFQDERGGRVNHGTLFYLRGCHFHEK